MIEVVNEARDPHDLAVDDGPRTAVLDPGGRQRLDLGEVTAGTSGRCTIGDHDIAGMTLDVEVTLTSSGQRRRVVSSAGKNASIRSSWAVTSIGVPMVEVTEKNDSSVPATRKRRSTTGAIDNLAGHVELDSFLAPRAWTG